MSALLDKQRTIQFSVFSRIADFSLSYEDQQRALEAVKKHEAARDALDRAKKNNASDSHRQFLREASNPTYEAIKALPRNAPGEARERPFTVREAQNVAARVEERNARLRFDEPFALGRESKTNRQAFEEARNYFKESRKARKARTLMNTLRKKGGNITSKEDAAIRRELRDIIRTGVDPEEVYRQDHAINDIILRGYDDGETKRKVNPRNKKGHDERLAAREVKGRQRPINKNRPFTPMPPDPGTTREMAVEKRLKNQRLPDPGVTTETKSSKPKPKPKPKPKSKPEPKNWAVQPQPDRNPSAVVSVTRRPAQTRTPTPQPTATPTPQPRATSTNTDVPDIDEVIPTTPKNKAVREVTENVNENFLQKIGKKVNNNKALTAGLLGGGALLAGGGYLLGNNRGEEAGKEQQRREALNMYAQNAVNDDLESLGQQRRAALQKQGYI